VSRLKERYLVEENGSPGDEYEVVDVVELFSQLLSRYMQASHLVDPLFDRGGQVRITRVG
jgi:hypothetical protein